MTRFKNLADLALGQTDEIISQELEKADALNVKLDRHTNAINCSLIGKRGSWFFYRKDYFYLAANNNGGMSMEKARAFSHAWSQKKGEICLDKEEVHCEINIGQYNYVTFYYSLFTERSVREFIKLISSFKEQE